MVWQRLIACKLAPCVTAVIALGIPNTSLARDCECKKIAPWVCIADKSCICSVQHFPTDIDIRPRIDCQSEKPYSRLKVLETGYSLLKDIGGEEHGYGLYSYAIVVNDNDRSSKFLGDVFNAVPPIEGTAAKRSQTNIFYIPTNNNKINELLSELYYKQVNLAGMSAAYATSYYDYKMARTLLDHLCDSPAKEIKAACEGDLSRGPYIFTYAKPASKVSPVPPPFLFIDLSDVHERAFPEFIAAFRAQVKREDIRDRVKIDTLRLKLLSIVLTSADWVAPVQKAIADIVHPASGQSEKDKK